MPPECLNRGKKIYFSNLRIEFFFFISNSFLAFVWLPRKWRKTICVNTIEAWSHTHLHIQHTICKIHKFQNKNSTAPNKPRLKPTRHQHILQIQNQPRNPFVEKNSVKYEPSWLVILVISAILCCGFGGGDLLLIVDPDLELLFSYNIVIKIV